jgi:hypothetical protein
MTGILLAIYWLLYNVLCPQSTRVRTAVDVVCSTTLLMAMSADRYQHKKEEAWKWDEPLTPYSIKLRDEAFDDINYQKYLITIEEATVKWICRLTRVFKGHEERTCFFLVVPVIHLTRMAYCTITWWLL